MKTSKKIPNMNLAKNEEIGEDARVKKHSYPVLSEAEVAEQLQTMFPDRLGDVEMNFRSPDFVQLVMSLFIDSLLGVSVAEQNMMPLSVLSRYARHPEMHNNARYHFFVLVQRLAARACLSVSITQNDFTNPSPRRWLNILSGLINFFIHAMNVRSKQTEIRRQRQALLEERDRLTRQCAEFKRQVTESDCRRVEREVQMKAMQRQAKEQAVANRGLAEKLEGQKEAVAEQKLKVEEETKERDEALRLLKGAEDRLALVRYELVETPIDQIEAEVAQLEASVDRQKELFRQRQSRSSELQRQQTNLARSERALDEVLIGMERVEEGRRNVKSANDEISRLSRESSDREEEVAKQRAHNFRKEQSERQDTLIKMKLVQEQNDKQHEALRRKMESDLVMMDADLKTMEARTTTLNEQHADIRRRQTDMEQQRARRLQQLDWTIRTGSEKLVDFQGRAKNTLTRLLK